VIEVLSDFAFMGLHFGHHSSLRFLADVAFKVLANPPRR